MRRFLKSMCPGLLGVHGLILSFLALSHTPCRAGAEEFGASRFYAVGGEIQDLLLDETRGRFWVLRKTTNRVEAYSIATGNMTASIGTGLEPESFAMTHDRKYIGVGSRGNFYVTIIDLDTTTRLGFYNTGNFGKVFRVTALGANDLIMVTRPDSFGSPPQGGRLNVWHGGSHTMTLLPDEYGAEHCLAGLPPSDDFIFGAWGYSQGGLGLDRIDRATSTTTLQDAFFNNVFLNADTMFSVDPVHRQFMSHINMVGATGSSLTFRGPLPWTYTETRPIFSPTNADRVVLTAINSPTVVFFDLGIFQPDFSVDLPVGTIYRGKGSFTSDGVNLYVIVSASPNNGIVKLSPPPPPPTGVDRRSWTRY